MSDQRPDEQTEGDEQSTSAGGEEYGSLSVEDNPVPNVRPWRQYFRGDVAKADFLAVSIEADGSTPVVPTSDKIIVLAPLT